MNTFKNFKIADGPRAPRGNGALTHISCTAGELFKSIVSMRFRAFKSGEQNRNLSKKFKNRNHARCHAPKLDFLQS